MTVMSAQPAPGFGVDWTRGMAVTGTVAVHAGLVALALIFAAPTETAPVSRTIDLVFASAPERAAGPAENASAELATDRPDPVATQAADPVTVSPALTPGATPRSPSPASSPTLAQTSAPVRAASPPAGPEPAILTAPDGRAAFAPDSSVGDAVRSGGALRGLVCATGNDHTRSAVGCAPQDSSAGFAAFAAFEGSPHFDADRQAEISARFDAAGPDPLTGPWLTLAPYARAGTALGASSRVFASSDSMRDRLPPSIPDPAFGD
jgi:hypothetical protein